MSQRIRRVIKRCFCLAHLRRYDNWQILNNRKKNKRRKLSYDTNNGVKMAIEYQCKNCNKKFKVRDFMGLTMFTKDNKSAVSGRKCDSCGGEICADDKSVTA